MPEQKAIIVVCPCERERKIPILVELEAQSGKATTTSLQVPCSYPGCTQIITVSLPGAVGGKELIFRGEF